MYHILPESRLRRIFPAVYFVNANPPEERLQVLLSKKELSELPDNRPNIFKKSNINRYTERPNAITQNFYTLENKPSKTGEYRLDKLDDNLIENNHEECS